MFKNKLSLVPHLPGSYQMKNKDNVIIYVGKAKDLHNRLSSYFNGVHTGKTAKMISEIADFEYIVTTTETESFILEINLIKQLNPKYNISLTDDKSYPYIEYISKPYPKVKVSRYLKIKKKDSKNLFGPYPNAYAARRIVNLLNRFYPLKKCNGNPKKVCLYNDINECLGYCVKEVNPEEVKAMEKEILAFLKGNDSILKEKIKEKIAFHSENLNYEQALELKNELDYINVVLDKQKVQLQDMKDRDVFNYYFDKGYLCVQIFFIRNGKLLGSHNEIIPVIIDEIDEFEYYIVTHYLYHEKPAEILTNSNVNTEVLSELLNIPVKSPAKGEKKKLVEMAKTNAKIYFDQEFETIKKDESRSIEANEELRKILNLNKLDRIDVFDNSNLFGTFSVSGMIVFKNGKPSKKDYRKYKISLEENDDYHTMKEVIYRRYYRALMEKTELPDLIIVDGGINQINACMEVIDDLKLSIFVCGLKKNDKHRTSELINGETKELIKIDKTSNLFHYLTRIQDEVHRYTINYHRTIRSKGSIASLLDNIDGIGKVRKKELIKKYGSITKIKESSIDDLKNIVPETVAINIKKFFDNYN